VIADRTTYDVRYCYRPLSWITVDSMSIYLATVSVCFLYRKCAVDMMSTSIFAICGQTIQALAKCWKKWIRTELLWTWWYKVQHPTPTLSATTHFVTDWQTDRRQYHVNSRSHCVTRSSAIAVIADRTACSILTLYSLWWQHLDLWINKTAELSQRWPRDAPNIWVPGKVLRVLTMHPVTFPEICNGLLFRSVAWWLTY